ncbi:MAG: PQQ-binding-like beta-propeller repeat protein [Deltaproteobacteria bacterium]|nr:PQQ-binding-like beta-propeller repeat protein [Deltaproteobacteria bacterium]
MAVLLLASAACKKDSGPPKIGFSTCIENWPAAGGPHPVRSSLSVEAPRLLWAIDVAGSQSLGGRIVSSDGGPVLAGDRLAFQAGAFIYFVNKDGTDPQSYGAASSGSYPSGVVADLEGNVYSVAQGSIFSLDRTGRLRWQGGGAGQLQGEFPYYDPPVLGPDGVVYGVASDERVYALRTSDGKTLWSKPAPKDKYHASYMAGGVGNGLFVQMGADRTDVLNTTDGSTMGTIRVLIDGVPKTPSSGLSDVYAWTFGIAQSADFVYDACGNLRWSKWSRLAPNASGVIAVGERLVVTSYQTDEHGNPLSPNMMTLYDAEGTVVGGPMPVEGRPLAAGADGTIYTVRCEGGTPPINRIVAYTSDLLPLWSFDLGGDFCLGMNGNVVLDDDGVMYLKRTSPNLSSTQVMAIQTRSPGLADSSWPSWRHDNRGTAWLVPGVATSGNADAHEAQEVSEAADLPGETR